jgi:hypothetical protein
MGRPGYGTSSLDEAPANGRLGHGLRVAQVASPEPDAAAAETGEPHSAHLVQTPVGAVAAASAQLAAAEERLTAHNEALAGWVGVLEEIRSQLAAALVREQEVRAGLASIGARVERLEREQAARGETTRGRGEDESGSRLLPDAPPRTTSGR